MRCGQLSARPDGFGGCHPVHLAEVLVRDVARVDAGAESAHEAGPGGLAEDGRADGVHAHQPHPGVQLAQDARYARGVPAGADAADQYVDVAHLGGEFEGERGVGGDVVGVVVLVGAPGVGLLRQQFGDAVAAGLLPATGGVWFADHVDGGAVGGEQPGHRRFQARVGDEGDGMCVDHPRQGEAEAEGAAGRLDDRASRPQVPRLRARSTMCSPGRSLMPPGLKPSSLAQKPRSAGVKGWETCRSGVLPTSPWRVEPAGVESLVVKECISVRSHSVWTRADAHLAHRRNGAVRGGSDGADRRGGVYTRHRQMAMRADRPPISGSLRVAWEGARVTLSAMSGDDTAVRAAGGRTRAADGATAAAPGPEPWQRSADSAASRTSSSKLAADNGTSLDTAAE